MNIPGSSTRRLVIISMLAACGLILFVFEAFIPVPVPWFRPGLGNVATIIALLMFGLGDAMKVTLLRVVLGALILGRLFTPLFVFALTGGIASAIVMYLVYRYWRVFGPVGISVLGAVAHNMVQLTVAFLFFVKSVEMFIFIPVFIATAVITGNITGLIAAMVMERGKRLMEPTLAPDRGQP